jgi:serine/threonine protein kinase
MSVVKEQIVLTEENKITILKGILEGLDYIHYKKIADRDVKPQNIIVNLETFQPKLLDFGLALFLNENTPIEDFKRCGTMGYIAP